MLWYSVNVFGFYFLTFILFQKSILYIAFQLSASMATYWKTLFLLTDSIMILLVKYFKLLKINWKLPSSLTSSIFNQVHFCMDKCPIDRLFLWRSLNNFDKTLVCILEIMKWKGCVMVDQLSNQGKFHLAWLMSISLLSADML